MLLAGVLAGCTGQASKAPTPAPPTLSTAGEMSCSNAVQKGSLPTWARAGFSPPATPIPHVGGVHGGIVGVAFGYPLHAPKPEPGHGNKILWVANPGATANAPPEGVPSGKLKIHATLNGSTLTVDRKIDLGPSLTDMPRPGCWTFTLSWGGHQDQLAVPYEPT